MSCCLTAATVTGTIASAPVEKAGVRIGVRNFAGEIPAAFQFCGFFVSEDALPVMGKACGASKDAPFPRDGTPICMSLSAHYWRSDDKVNQPFAETNMSNPTQVAPATFSLETIRTANGLFSLNDLHKASGGANRHSPRYWLQNQQTTDLAKEIEKDGIPSIFSKQGIGTFVCKELVIAYAAWISPAFHLRVIRAFLTRATSQNGTYQAPQKPESPRLHLRFGREEGEYFHTTTHRGETWYRLGDIGIQLGADAHVLSKSVPKSEYALLRVRDPRLGWQRCLWASARGVDAVLHHYAHKPEVALIRDCLGIPAVLPPALSFEFIENAQGRYLFYAEAGQNIIRKLDGKAIVDLDAAQALRRNLLTLAAQMRVFSGEASPDVLQQALAALPERHYENP